MQRSRLQRLGWAGSLHPQCQLFHSLRSLLNWYWGLHIGQPPADVAGGQGTPCPYNDGISVFLSRLSYHPQLRERPGFATPLVAGCIKNETDGSWWCLSHPSCYGVGDVVLLLHPEVYAVGVSA